MSEKCLNNAVLFLVFNRPDPTRRVFEAIRAARPARLYVAGDGPRKSREGEQASCDEVRKIATAVDWPCRIKTLFRERNLGCKMGVAKAIDWFFANEESGIILEDDCLPCPEFFNFCSEMLAHYRDQDQIMAVTGTNYQAGHWRGEASYYFSRFPHIWGWASWRRAWKHYDVTMESWPKDRKEKWMEKVCPPVERSFWTDFFDQVHAGKIDTWDGQWLYAIWRHSGIGIIPNVNLITNIGAGPDATHTKGDPGSLEIAVGQLGQVVHPNTVSIDTAADDFTYRIEFGGKAGPDTRTFPKRVKRSLMRLLNAGLGSVGYQITRDSIGTTTSRVLQLGPYKVWRR